MSARRVSADRIRRRRLAALSFLLLTLFVAVLARLVGLQAVGDDRYVTFGQSQRIRSITLPADRGSIFDRNGNDLAISIPQRTVWADPRFVDDVAKTATTLSPILGLDRTLLENKLSSRGAFVYLARRVPDPVADEVAKLKLDGIYLLEEPTRFTPGGDLGHAVLGTVGVDNDGLSGLELQYDKLLTGKPGEVLLERDPEGRTISSGQRSVQPAQRGRDLVLTIDRSFQFEAERLLAQRVVETGAKGGTAIVARPGSGEILALANVAVDAETGELVSTGNNRAVTAVFEPGSVNKMITLAGALQQGVVTPSTEIEVPDQLQVSDHVFSDHDPHPTANYTVTRILAESLNIGTIKIGQMLGRDHLDHYLRSFGLGSSTGLDFPNESKGLMLAADKWSGTSYGSIPIGQGIAVTAMQMLFAFNTIANDGVYVPPRLVLADVDRNGKRHPISVTAKRHRVVSQRTAHQMRSMLAEVVADGTGTKAALDGYTVAGKTGTARKPQPNGGYTDEAGHYHYVATFAGFLPADHPELSIIVVVDEPSSTIFGGAVSAPVFADLGRYGMRFLRIPPSEQREGAVLDQATDLDAPTGNELVRSEPAGSGSDADPTPVDPLVTTTTEPKAPVVEGPD